MGRRRAICGRGPGLVLEFKQPEPPARKPPTAPSVGSTSRPTAGSSTKVVSANGDVIDLSTTVQTILKADDNESLIEKLSQKVSNQEGLMTVIEELKKHISQRESLYKVNLSPSYEEFENLRKSKKLDSTLKKCNGFVRRLRNYTNSQRQAVESETATLNLSKYLSEICAAVVETRLKVADMPDIVSICSAIHVRYQEFSELMLETFKSTMNLKKTELTPNTLSKLSLDLRLLTELVLCGVLNEDGLNIIIGSIRSIVCSDKEAQCIIPILTLAKAYGYELAGIVPSHLKVLCDTHSVALPATGLIPSSKQLKIKMMLKEYMNTVTTVWVQIHEDVLNSELACRRMLKLKGEVTKEREEKHAEVFGKFEKFDVHVRKMACYVDFKLPELRVLVPDPEEEALLDDLGLDVGVEGGSEVVSLFDDEETRAFYQDLPDLTKYLTSAAKRENALHLEKEAEKLAAAEAAVDEEKEKAELQAEGPGEDDADSVQEADGEPSNNQDKAHEETKSDEPVPPTMVAYLNSLLNCINRNMVDEAVELFLNKFNNKPNRRKLAHYLCHLPRQRLDLIPFWSRYIAVIRPITPDVSDEVTTYLRREFGMLVRRKNQIFIETKLKFTRFIGELVNFGIFPPSEAFQCFKFLLMDFTHHQIEMACVFVEICGRYLHKNPATRRRMKIYLDEMMRKKQAKALEPRYVHMVDHSYFCVHPPEAAAKKRKPPALVAYVTDLIHNNLTRANLEESIYLIRRLEWDENLTNFMVQLFSQPWKMTHQMLTLNASLLAGIRKYHRDVIVRVLDSILEEIRSGMEVPDPRNNQRMVALVIFLSELFCYRLTTSRLIFETLYSFVSVGVSYDYRIRTFSDPPDSGFRIRLACTLLKGVGEHFTEGSAKVRTKLKYYLKYLQRYFYYKKEDPIWAQKNRAFPYGTTLLFEDTIYHLGVEMDLYETYQRASEKITRIEKHLMEKLKVEMREKGFPEIIPPLHERHLQNIPESCEEESSPAEAGNENINRSLSQEYPAESVSKSPLPGLSSAMPQQQDFMLEEPRLLEPHEVSSAPPIIGASREEIEEFDRELEKMINEASYSASSRDARHVNVNTDIRIPMNIHKQTKDSTPTEPGMVKFALLLKKGNKPNIKHVDVPETDEVVQRMRRREAVEREERAQLKKLTLGINQLQIDEEMEEVSKTQPQVPIPRRGYK